MRSENGKHKRLSIRLKGYNYSRPGLHFITIVTDNQDYIFGTLKHNKLKPNRYGDIAIKDWLWLEYQYWYVSIDTWILMPNHIHGILDYFNNPIDDCSGQASGL